MTQRWLAALLCILCAAMIGYLIGNSHTLLLIALLVASVAVGLVAGLGRSIWLLALVGWAFTGSIRLLPIPFAIRDMCVMLALAGYVSFRIVAGRQMHVRWTWLDCLVAVNLVWIGVTFALNPVGLRALGSETMGGRPYFNIAIAAIAYWTIVRLPNSPAQVAKLPYFIVAGVSVVALLNLLAYLFPPLVPYLWQFYGGVDVSAYLQATSADGDVRTRWKTLQVFGIALTMLMCASYRPLTLFHPLRLRCYFFLVGLAAILATGFRNAVLWAFACVGISSFYHRGWRDCVVVGVIAAATLTGLVYGQGRFYELPYAAQRALTFLPGDWNPQVVEETRMSSTSRWEWWRIVIKERLIGNWWVGDGFGVSQRDYSVMTQQGKVYDWFTLTGNFHNGPLTTIRYAGIIGLVLFYSLMIGSAVMAVRLAHRARATELQVAALYLTIQLVWTPIHYTVVYGAYEVQMAQHVFLIGLLRAVERMLPAAAPATPPGASAASPQVPAAKSVSLA